MALVCLLCSQVILKNAASPVRMLVSAVVGLLVYFVSTVVLRGATRHELSCFAAGDVLDRACQYDAAAVMVTA